ncbi:two-component system, chemotaxis family, response regulator CheB [Desulfonispora thiosulfatigenes DSM 11270]|uniref:Protein-glutamate methylesterase/protein-glutamine glutaminase n=1 Tax=Desulfonispora thiosulfatigenes DSM 11270 TaxID=656914 RepID=A0A1W1UP25_DESTI|nr:chemotaxis response regulator protein-glutamate methylesterase [Desulfonispora thiosulfatigenes]SMB82875.1 two-component system, chemotaxis family, response regulator CheB [Desulfonispora thiosulfatigenes DSM 11270]
MSPIKVMVVDDSAFMRRIIISTLEKSNEIEIVGYARNGEDALNKIKIYKPDVITLDVEMPIMNGIETLEKLICENPLPVIMISSLTTEGASLTLHALELGAVDFVAKPEKREEMALLEEELVHKVKIAARVKVNKKCTVPGTIKKPELSPEKIKQDKINQDKKIDVKNKIEVVAIGTSTGGPPALQKLLLSLPKNFPVGIVIVQHMPKGFTGPLATRLNKLCEIDIKEAEEGDKIAPGKVLIAPAGYQIDFKRTGKEVIVNLKTVAPIQTRFKPSVDVMLLSLKKVYGGNCLGVILTGMGSDGTIGLTELKKLGATVLAQDEASSVVYGMPKSAVEAGVVDKILPLSQIAGEMQKIVRK